MPINFTYPFIILLPEFDFKLAKCCYFDKATQIWRIIICCQESITKKQYVIWFNIFPSGVIIDYTIFPERHTKFFIAIDEQRVYRLSQEGHLYIYDYRMGQTIFSKIPYEIDYFQVAGGSFLYWVIKSTMLVVPRLR
jgi:hypothetical protein